MFSFKDIFEHHINVLMQLNGNRSIISLPRFLEPDTYMVGRGGDK